MLKPVQHDDEDTGIGCRSRHRKRMGPEEVRAAWDKKGCQSEVDDCDGTRVVISRYWDEEFWTYFIDGENGTFDQLVFSYLGDSYELGEGFAQLNRFNDEAVVARLSVNEHGALSLNAKILIEETELTENILSTYMIAWLMDFENMVHLLNKGKGN